MDWLNMLKANQETAPDTIRSFSIMPNEAVSKVSKVKAPEQDDIFAPDYLDIQTTADDSKPSLYCADGGCHCSQMLPGNDYPAGCGKCEYLNNPKQAKQQAETIPATFEQTGAPVSCPYWYQVCHAVSFYQESCTRCTDCQIFKFLRLNS